MWFHPRADATRVAHPAGFSLQVPAGWQAHLSEDGVVMVKPGREALILAVPHDLTSVSALAAESDAGLHLDGRSLAPAGAVQTLAANAIGREFAGHAQGTPARAWAVGVVMPQGGVTLVAIASQAAYGPEYVQLVDAIRTSLVFRPMDALAPAAPEATDAAAWTARLRGQKLTYLESYASTGGGGYRLRRELWLCTDGRYAFSGRSSPSADVPGVSAHGRGSSAENGRWRVIETGGSALLRLEADDGSVRQHRLRRESGRLLLDGQRWFRGHNDRCP